jgi:hypothetical protein
VKRVRRAHQGAGAKRARHGLPVVQPEEPVRNISPSPSVAFGTSSV